MEAAPIDAFASAIAMLDALSKRRVSAVELLDLHLRRIERYNPDLGAIVTFDVEHARQAAKAADEASARGDGLRPIERAEQTLRLFLGEQLYQQLETHGFLDVSSVRYAEEQRVYRLRRDPGKLCERRVRVFIHGQYFNDFCIVRAQSVPEADHFLTVSWDCSPMRKQRSRS